MITGDCGLFFSSIVSMSPSLPQIFSDEDDLTYPQVPSSSSSGSGDSEQSTNAYTNDLDTSKTFKPPRNRKNEKPIPSSSSANNLHFQQSAGSMKLLPPELVLPHPQSRMFNNNLPIVYAPHSSPAMLNQHIHQFPCKYPGCNQVGVCNAEEAFNKIA